MDVTDPLESYKQTIFSMYTVNTTTWTSSGMLKTFFSFSQLFILYPHLYPGHGPFIIYSNDDPIMMESPWKV